MLGVARRAIVPRLDPSRATPGVAVAAGVAASILLGLSGAADSVSMIFRNTILQASVPDAMRGRLQGLFTVVVTGGPRVGDLYVGVLSVTALLWMPPPLGGWSSSSRRGSSCGCSEGCGV